MKYLIVIPYVYEPYFLECKATLDSSLNIMAINNVDYNIGVANSWNKGVTEVLKKGYDWLIICSAAMRFGESQGRDMIEQLENNPHAQIINFANDNVKEGQFIRGKSPGVESGMFSWHCCAISRKVLEEVGKFDANFFPIYFEDVDYDLRVNKYYNGKALWPIVHIKAYSKSIGHAAKLGGIESPSESLIAYFATKWGKHPSAESINSYDHPFNNKNNSLAFWPPAHGELWNA